MGKVDNGNVLQLNEGTTDAQWEVKGGSLLTGKVSFPDDTLVLWVDGGSRVSLEGRALAVEIRQIDGQSEVDVSRLSIGAFTSSKVDGQSTVRFQTNNMNARLQDGINGQSHVYATMIGNGHFICDGWIDGQSSLDLNVEATTNGTGRCVFNGKIDGQSRVYLTLGEGEVVGKEVSGASHVSYKYGKPQHPDVHFDPVHNGASVQEVLILQPV